MGEEEIRKYVDCHIKKLNTPHHRYISWKWCYQSFEKAFQEGATVDEKKRDHLALHLGMYLASYGMLRGSSFLLDCDYTIHLGFVDNVLKERDLWEARNDMDRLHEKIDRILKFSKEIDNYYEGKVLEFEEDKESKSELKTNTSPSATLVTKILMGTLCCTPAYDRFFVGTFFKAQRKDLNEKSLEELFVFYNKYKNVFEPYEKMGLPPMRLLDMVFFESGLEETDKRKNA